MAQITSSYAPTYGYPNTTHNVTVSVANNQTAVPSGATTFYVTLAVKNDIGATLQTFTSTTYSTGWTLGETKDFVITGIPFASAMTCTIGGTINVTTIMMMPGVPPLYTPMPFPMPFSYTIPSQNYIAQFPPNLTITNTSNDLSVTTPLNGYSVRYYLDGDGTAINESITGNYTAATSGNYAAKGYDILSTCLSENASNTIALSITAIEEAKAIAISVYPNPVASSVTIETGSAAVLTYELSDLNGKIMRTASFQKISSINMEDLKSGSYILTVKSGEEKVSSYKLVR